LSVNYIYIVINTLQRSMQQIRWRYVRNLLHFKSCFFMILKLTLSSA